ncbi:MAG: YgjV family protein, partial [Clostridia bacterium]|nr:YgjV family protein [Clostridia bacterium]
MELIDYVAQGFGIVGMVFNILVFQQKKQKNVLLFQLFAAVSFGINYFMLGAVMGGLLNVVGALRSVIYYFEKKTRANSV